MALTNEPASEPASEPTSEPTSDQAGAPPGDQSGTPAGEPTADSTSAEVPADEHPVEEHPGTDQDAAASDDEVPAAEGSGAEEGTPAADAAGPGETDRPAVRRFTATRAVVMALLGLLGFTLAIQVRSVSDDPELAALGQEDLVRILANLDDHEERLQEDIAELQETRRRLENDDESRQEALAEARRRADELGILAGTLPAQGPGITVEFHTGPGAVTAATLLDAVQELRSAGAEAMQIEGGGASVRVVASTYFNDTDGGIVVDGVTLRSPYLLTAIGEPQTLAPALRIPSGVVESVVSDGGTVTVRDVPGGVEVSTVREPGTLQYARPVS